MASFDVLMSLYTEPDEDSKVEALEIITYINCTISIMGILITVITLLAFGILRRKLFNQVLCQYLLSMLAVLVVFLAGIKQTQSKQRCLIVAALLHYFLNTSFFWMFAHAILAYIHYVENFVVDTPKFLIRSSLCCWGIPFVVILIIVVFTYDHKQEIFKYCCWPMGNELHFYFLFSAGFVMIVNTLMFVKIVYSFFFDRSKALRTNQSSIKWTAKRLGTAVNLFFLLGLPWSFGFFTLEKTRLAFKYLFTVFVTLQGFVVFINVIFRTSVRDLLSNCMCRKKCDNIQISTIFNRQAVMYVNNNFSPHPDL